MHKSLYDCSQRAIPTNFRKCSPDPCHKRKCLTGFDRDTARRLMTNHCVQAPRIKNRSTKEAGCQLLLIGTRIAPLIRSPNETAPINATCMLISFIMTPWTRAHAHLLSNLSLSNHPLNSPGRIGTHQHAVRRVNNALPAWVHQADKSTGQVFSVYCCYLRGTQWVCMCHHTTA